MPSPLMLPPPMLPPPTLVEGSQSQRQRLVEGSQSQGQTRPLPPALVEETQSLR